MFCYRGNLLHFGRLWPYFARPPFVTVAMHSFCWLCHVIQSDMLEGLSPSHSFIYFHLSLPILHQHLFLLWLSLLMLYWIIGPFVFRVLGFASPVVAPGLVLCIRDILPYMNSRLLHSCCIKWPFVYPVRWLSDIWTIVLLKIIYVIKVVQLLFSFWD